MLREFGDEDWANFKARVRAATGVRLDDYKPEQMRRRVATMANRAGASSFTTYFHRMDREPSEMAAFLERMTINVSELFRNPERFADLHDLVTEALPASPPGRLGVSLSIWSAGCSYGAEVYSLAILLDEMRLLNQAHFMATDIDKSILERARAGRFQKPEIHNLSPERRDTYFKQAGEGEYCVIDRLRDRVTFREHDLLANAYPKNTYDLIVCRNVVIYFTDKAKKRVYEGLLAALKPGGILFIGSTERISDHREIGFDLLMPFFYSKPLAPGEQSVLGGNRSLTLQNKAA